MFLSQWGLAHVTAYFSLGSPLESVVREAGFKHLRNQHTIPPQAINSVPKFWRELWSSRSFTDYSAFPFCWYWTRLRVLGAQRAAHTIKMAPALPIKFTELLQVCDKPCMCFKILQQSWHYPLVDLFWYPGTFPGIPSSSSCWQGRQQPKRDWANINHHSQHQLDLTHVYVFKFMPGTFCGRS